MSIRVGTINQKVGRFASSRNEEIGPDVFDSIKDKNGELVFSLNTSDMDSALFEQVAKVFNTHADLKNGEDGVPSDFTEGFGPRPHVIL